MSLDTTAAGIWADTSSTPAFLATGDNANAGLFYNNAGFATLYANNALPTTSGTGYVFFAQGAGVSNCYIDTGGNLNCTGSITGVAITPHQRKVEMYGIQATESWYEDAGSASLINGSAVVQLDSNFAGIANTGVGYQVFLTPNANCNGLYVANKTTRSFEVHELGGVMRAYRLIIGSWPNARAWKRTACAI